MEKESKKKIDSGTYRAAEDKPYIEPRKPCEAPRRGTVHMSKLMEELSENLNMHVSEGNEVITFVTQLVQQGEDPHSIVEKTLEKFQITDPFKTAFVGCVCAVAFAIDAGLFATPSEIIRRLIYAEKL